MLAAALEAEVDACLAELSHERDEAGHRLVRRNVNAMHDVHAHHDDTYGSPRMTSELHRRGFRLNRKRTERLMRVASQSRCKRLQTQAPL